MDDEKKDIFKMYHDKIYELVEHLVENPLISDDDSGDFMRRIGSHIFKLGHGLKQKVSPHLLRDYHIALISDEMMGDMKDTLADLQNRELKRVLDEELKKCTNEHEAKIIQSEFDETIKHAQFEYVEPQAVDE